MQQDYIQLDPWKIIENQWDKNKVMASESLFSLGNGAMGLRANFEEDYSGESFQGSYVGGIYYPDKTKVGWWKNGYPEYFAKVLNAPSWIGISIRVNGENLDLAQTTIHAFERSLDMKQGLYTRTFDVTTSDGVRLKGSVDRFLSLKRTEVGAIRYQLEAVNAAVDLEFCSYLDGHIKNQDSNWDDPFWEAVSQKGGTTNVLVNRTFKTTFGVGTYMQNQLSVAGETVIDAAIKNEQANRLEETYNCSLSVGSVASLVKIGGYVSTLHHPEEELISVAEREATAAMEAGFDQLLQEQQKAWAEIWEMADIQIQGDVSSQQAIRFNIFQLNQTYNGADARLNIGPKGFTGEKYGGSTYWDTEAYCLPFYMATKPQKVARNLLQYRYQQLDKAIENAQKLGFINGAALYPMVTMNGEECHNEWEITFEEIHRNGAIAYAIFNYTRYTDDQTYIPEMGLEVLIGIARFWAQRVSWSQVRSKYVILGVTGPNEYENNINNNWYTNYLAKWCLEYACEQIDAVKKYHSADFERIAAHVDWKDSEAEQWMKVASHMYFPYDETLEVFLQQDGFLDKELVPAASLPSAIRPLNQYWSWDRILRSPYIKQADTLQGFYMFAEDFSKEVLEKHYNFYEPFTVHESSLSPCIHAILAARLDRMEEAYAFYLRTSRLDLDDYNKEVHEGLHITSMAGTWMSIVEGFGGLTLKNGQLCLNPKLPPNWSSFRFKILFRGSVLEVFVDAQETKLFWHGDNPLSLNLKGKAITITK